LFAKAQHDRVGKIVSHAGGDTVLLGEEEKGDRDFWAGLGECALVNPAPPTR
jgi:hypothetical protein